MPPHVAADDRALIADPAMDAVLICTPTHTYAEIIIAAEQAGKHILCEKPIALNLEDTDAALDAVARVGVKLQVGFNRRFDPNYARVRKAVASGEMTHRPHPAPHQPRDPLRRRLNTSKGQVASFST